MKTLISEKCSIEVISATTRPWSGSSSFQLTNKCSYMLPQILSLVISSHKRGERTQLWGVRPKQGVGGQCPLWCHKGYWPLCLSTNLVDLCLVDTIYNLYFRLIWLVFDIFTKSCFVLTQAWTSFYNIVFTCALKCYVLSGVTQVSTFFFMS